MRSVAGRNRWGRALVALVVVALVLAAAGCGVIRGAVSMGQELGKAGFGTPNVEMRSGDTIVVTVEKDAEDLDAAAQEAAGLVWRKLPLPIERLEVTCENGFGGEGTFAADRAELEQRFGARDPELDRGFQDGDLRTVGLVLGALFVGGLLVLGGVLTLVLVLIRRSRRRTPPPGPPGPPWGSQPPPPGYGPPA